MTVYLVGAGPGDPGLLTRRGAEVLALADVVVHDRLLDRSVLALAPESADRVDVGKTPGGPIRQEEINALLVEHGRAGRTVVRLKGGDPFVLGRGGEEAQALAGAGVEFEVVPGVTSAVAVPAYAGIPVTHRGLAASFTVVTGHSRHSAESEPDWDALARSGGTIVVLMGVAHRGDIASRLMAGGLAPSTAVAAITRGTYSMQRTTRTTLARLGDADVEPTAVIVVGAVAALDLTWFETRPLLGRRVVVTRALDQAGELTTELRAAGADPVVVPVIRIAPPGDEGLALRAALAELHTVDWVVFSSANAVDAVFANVRDARAFGRARIATVGPRTAEALRAHGIQADLVPERFSADGLLERFPAPPKQGGTVLLPQARDARPTLAHHLEAKRWKVVGVEAYCTEPVAPEPEAFAEAAGCDAITFLSPSSVSSYIAAGGKSALPPVVVCIGPVTAEAARQAGLEVTAVAASSTVRGVVDALAMVLREED